MTEPNGPIDPNEPPFPEEEAAAEEPAPEELSPDEPLAALPASPPAVAVTGRVPAAAPARPDLVDRQEPLYRTCRGFRLRLEPPDLARLRELPGSRGKSDGEIGESFFDGQAERIAASVAGDVPDGSELRIVVDPYSRQAFVALENRIRGILSF
ncbi:MAG TPA: hypothetical protein VIB08_01575 [Thermoanaerobaculia bacterium]|jgi:hypothetical protein